MAQEPIRSIVIVGGGVAGWMTAALLSRLIPAEQCRIELVEPEQTEAPISGEATTPAIHDFHRRAGVDEREFMAATQATFKLGTEFVNWGAKGDSYFHPCGTFGRDMNGVGFHQYWLRARQEGDSTPFDAYSLPWLAARRRRFGHPTDDPRSVYSTYSYAFHFDASLYADFLQRIAERRGVVRTEGRVVDVELGAEDGFVDTVVLEGDKRIAGEFFVDCSGFRGLLIEEALQTGYEEWSRWLPCDRSFAVTSSHDGEAEPFSRATAHPAGWQWRIPLRQRMDNGHVFASEFIDEDQAARTLLGSLNGKPHGAPRLLKFVPGKRRQFWNRNCVAVGPSGGCLEPLESTGILLIQAAVMKLVELFPDKAFPRETIDTYNRDMGRTFDEVRDFIILHYKQTERSDSAFWRYCKGMRVPDELAFRMRLFEERGVVTRRDGELFVEADWLAVYLGQKLFPQGLDPRVDCMSVEERRSKLAGMRDYLIRAAEALPPHAEAIAAHCATQTGSG